MRQRKIEDVRTFAQVKSIVDDEVTALRLETAIHHLYKNAAIEELAIELVAPVPAEIEGRQQRDRDRQTSTAHVEHDAFARQTGASQEIECPWAELFPVTHRGTVSRNRSGFAGTWSRVRTWQRANRIGGDQIAVVGQRRVNIAVEHDLPGVEH